MYLKCTGYHIPCLIYSPKNIIPREIECKVAQIDLPPTILGILNFDYTSMFFGQDAISPEPPERLYIRTYKGLGYIKNDRLIIQKPAKKIEEFHPDFPSGHASKTIVNDSLAVEAIAYYQVTSRQFKHNKYIKSG